MAGETRNIFYMALGFIDYVRDRIEELEEELMERGEEKSEDLREFIGDLLEITPFLKGKENGDEEWEELEEDKDPEGLENILEAIDIKGMIGDLMNNAGLASREDIMELNDRIERLGRAVENLGIK